MHEGISRTNQLSKAPRTWIKIEKYKVARKKENKLIETLVETTNIRRKSDREEEIEKNAIQVARVKTDNSSL